MRARDSLAVAATFVVVGVLVYANTFSASFHFDDARSITENAQIMRLGDLGAIWRFWPTRFVTYLSFAVNYHLGGLAVLGYHLVNLAVHVATALLVWRLVLVTFETPALAGSDLGPHAARVAFFAGLLFLVHPLQTQAVTYIVQRAASLTAFFYLLALTSWVRSRLLAAAGGRPAVVNAHYALALVAAVLAMFTKEMAVTLPLAILLYEAFFLRGERGLPWRRLAPLLATVAILPLTMWLTKSVDFAQMHRVVEQTAVKISPDQYFLTQARVTVTYLRLLVVPIGQNLDYDYPLATGPFQPATALSLLALLAILVLAIRVRRRYRLVSFGVLWFILTMLPESSVLPIADVIFEHRLYLPMVGFAIVVGAGAFHLLRHRSAVALSVLAALTLAFGVCAHARNAVWKDELTLWNDVVAKSPRKGRAYHNRGLALQAQGRFDEAIADYDRALALAPDLADSYANRGNCFRGRGQFDRAIADYDRALARRPGMAEAYAGRGSAWRSRGNAPQAVLDLGRAIRLAPNDPRLYNERAIALAEQGLHAEAVADYSQAITLSPRDADLYFNRGNAHVSAGAADQALADYAHAVELAPRHGAAHFALGNAWKDKGDLGQAIASYSRVLDLDPGNRAALHNRAAAYFLTGQHDRSWEDVRRLRALGADLHPEVLRRLQEASGRMQ